MNRYKTNICNFEHQNLTNTASTNQTFNVVLTLPTQLTSGTVVETGTLGLKLNDSGVDGSASLILNQWHGLINPLSPPPQLDMPLLIGSEFNCGGIGCATILSPVSNTQTHSEINHNGEAISSIGTHINFTLSAGDTVNLNTRWDVSPVPVPAAVWLFTSGLIGLFATSRFKKA